MAYYQQNVIAIVWDFDKTLIHDSMQDPLLRSRGINPSAFWFEVNSLSERYREQGITVAQGSAYLNHILTYVQEGKLASLSNAELNAAGADLPYYDGVPEVFDRLAAIVDLPKYQRFDLKVEHYIVSTGLRQIIEGSVVRSRVRDVWACEYIGAPIKSGQAELADQMNGEIQQVGYVIDDTSKTRALYEINKGVNDDPGIALNAPMDPSVRRVPFENMICVADGPSDVPMFSVMQQSGGKALGVWCPLSEKHFSQVSLLQEQKRVTAAFPADYRDGGAADLWLRRAVTQTADRIVERRMADRASVMQAAPTHVLEDTPTSVTSRRPDDAAPRPAREEQTA